MTALSESFSLRIICDVFPLPNSTFLLFSWVGKPVLDTLSHSISVVFYGYWDAWKLLLGWNSQERDISLAKMVPSSLASE